MKKSSLLLLFLSTIILGIFANNPSVSIGENVIIDTNNDGNVIDIMILYTATASQDMGGQSKIEQWIKDAVVSTNNAMRNSKVTLRFDLCHTRQVSYNESTNRIDLDNLTNGLNGLENVADLRIQYHADVVVMITNNTEGGQAQALMSLNGEHAKSRFAVIKAGSTSTFVHEVGHIFGAQHDGPGPNGATSEDGIFPYSHGYTGNNYTASSIVGGYVKSNNSTGKVNFYSNPNLTYRNGPMGSANFSDNHRTFNETAPAIDKLFNSETIWNGNSNTNWNNPANWSENKIPRAFDDVVIKGGVTNFPSIQSGTANCRNLFIESGSTLSISDGKLNIRGHLKAEGNLLASGGTVDMQCNLDKGAAISLSNSSYLHHLVIGGESTFSCIQLKSRLLLKGNITISPWAVLDPASHSIVVEGDWIDEGGAGFNYKYSDVKIDGITSINNTTYNFIIPPDPSGGSKYVSEIQGWGKGTEGNYAMNWMFGGETGQVWLKGTFYSNDPIGYIIDSWIFTPLISLSSGTTYKLEFEANSSKKGQGMQRADNGKYELHDLSIHYGKGQLPSLMNAVGTVQQVTSDNKWVTIENEFTVNADGKYDLGLRTFNNRDAWGADTFIRNIKITPVSKKTENFGNANIDFVISEPTTTSPSTTPATTDPTTPSGPVVNPATTTSPTNTSDPLTNTGTQTETGSNPSTTNIEYPILIATGDVYHVNNSINWRTYTYNVDLDRIEASYYAPQKDDGDFLAGNKYSIFMITHANKSQAFMEYHPTSSNWTKEIKKFSSGTVTPKMPGPNSFKPKDNLKVFYEPGKITWEISRGEEVVAEFYTDYTAENVTASVVSEKEKEENNANSSSDQEQAKENIDPETQVHTKSVGQELIMNDKIFSANREYYFILQSDGNAVIYTKSNKLIWETQTAGYGPHCRFAIQTDGHVVLYSQSDYPIWASETHEYWDPKYATNTWKPVKMVLENDGSLVFYSATNNKVWTSKLGKLPNTN